MIACECDLRFTTNSSQPEKDVSMSMRVLDKLGASKLALNIF